MSETMMQRIRTALIAALDDQAAVYVGDTTLNGVERPDVMVDGRVDIPAVVRAVLAAMREPTDAVAKRGDDAASSLAMSNDSSGVYIWQVMIDAALEEG